MVKIGQLILFSTGTGDAWLLEVTDQLAACLARDGDPDTIHLEDRYQLRDRMDLFVPRGGVARIPVEGGKPEPSRQILILRGGA